MTLDPEMFIIPIPGYEDAMDVIVAILAKNETESCRYYDDEIPQDTYMLATCKHMSEILLAASCCKTPTAPTLLEFWTQHRRFADWGLIQHRDGGYAFLDNIIKGTNLDENITRT